MAELLQLQPAAMSRELCFSKRHMKHGGRLVSIGYLQSAASNSRYSLPSVVLSISEFLRGTVSSVLKISNDVNYT
jgi:hypothetical protein